MDKWQNTMSTAVSRNTTGGIAYNVYGFTLLPIEKRKFNN